MKATGSKMDPSKGVLGYVALHSGPSPSLFK